MSHTSVSGVSPEMIHSTTDLTNSQIWTFSPLKMENIDFIYMDTNQNI